MNISFASTFRKHLDSLPSNYIKFVFPYLSRCSAVIHNNLAAVATLIFLRARGGGGGNGFSEPSSEEYTASRACVYASTR